MIRNKSTCNLCFDQILFIVQVFALLISTLMKEYVDPALGQAAYFTAVLSAPILMICLGHRYFQEERFRIITFLAFSAELVFFLLYFASLIYGIQEYSSTFAEQKLFENLLIVFSVDVLISALGFVAYRLRLRDCRVQKA